jgi:hypothetical protein
MDNPGRAPYQTHKNTVFFANAEKVVLVENPVRFISNLLLLQGNLIKQFIAVRTAVGRLLVPMGPCSAMGAYLFGSHSKRIDQM